MGCEADLCFLFVNSIFDKNNLSRYSSLEKLVEFYITIFGVLEMFYNDVIKITTKQFDVAYWVTDEKNHLTFQLNDCNYSYLKIDTSVIAVKFYGNKAALKRKASKLETCLKEHYIRRCGL